MTKILTTVLVALLSFSCSSCNTDLMGRKRITAKGPYITRSTEYVGDFDAIDSRGVADVEYTQTEGRPSITISGAENVLQYLIVEVRGNVLEIGIEKGIEIHGEHRLKVKATGKELGKIGTAGTGDIKVMGDLRTDRLEVRTSGTGDVEFRDITASGKVDIYTSGTGDVDFIDMAVSGNDVLIITSGTGDVEFGTIDASGNYVEINASGTGDVSGRKVVCSSAEINATGTADVEIGDIQVENIELAVTGSGDAELSGRANDFRVTVSGTGDADANRLIADKVVAKAAGTGSIYCHAVRELYATASGTGTIIYSGNPEIVEISGGRGRVRRSND